MARWPDEPGEFTFCAFNVVYGIGCVAVLVLVPPPQWASGWLPLVAWPFVAVFMAINVAGLFWSW